MKIRLLQQGAMVTPLLWALRCHPELWNDHNGRTKPADSPHRDVDDIWCRYAPEGVSGAVPHDSVWYPAADVLPVRELALDVMRRAGGTRLGGVLITQIAPGKSCRRHADQGWHARHYEKIAVQIESGPGQAFCFDGEQLETLPGDVFTFDNSHDHWVTNDTPFNRITLIVCVEAASMLKGN